MSAMRRLATMSGWDLILKDRTCGERISALQLPPITFGSREIAGSSS
jgi:hypothetical protein